MQFPKKYKILLALFAACAFTANTAMADKPEWAGKNKHENSEREWNKEERQADRPGGPYFNSHHRQVAGEYYKKSYRGGKCPPGLAKKQNGCLPPGQAKKWRRDQPLPREVVYYTVPHALVVELGVPPKGYKYVRVEADILMIATGSRLVVDAIIEPGHM